MFLANNAGQIRSDIVLVPEPSSIFLLGLGLGILGVTMRRRKTA
ncbi:MAG: PEP-CTERM sorting domain-containing protein [Chthoniobacterales bacterium]